MCQEFLPPGVLNVVCGDRDTGRALVEHKTPADGRDHRLGARRHGGRRVGAPRTLKRVHLELGGKAPVIVFDDADIEKAAEGIAERRLLQRRPGLHRGHPGARRPGRPRRLRRRADRAGQGDAKTGLPDDEDVLYGAAQQRRTSSTGSPAWSTGCPTTPASRPAAAARATAGYFYEPTVRLRPAAGRRADPGRDLRPGHHRAEVHRRGRGAALGQRRRVRPRLERLDQGPRPRDADGQAARLRRACGSTPTSRSSPRCRTAASSTRGYGKDLSMYGLEDYTRIKHVMSYIGE